MDNKLERSDLLISSKDVWHYLVNQGGLQPKTYDSVLEEDIRTNLHLPYGNFEILLNDVKLEDFIIAFFQAVQPFTSMMADLLQLFEKVGAKQTNKNIAISFDFAKDLPKLSFDLNHFRNWLTEWEEILEIYLVNRWDNKSLWKLNSILQEDYPSRNYTPNNTNLLQWIHQYRNEKIWPTIQLPAPKSDDEELDEILSKVWSIWDTIVTESSKYGRERSLLKEKLDSLSSDERLAMQNERIGWPLPLLRYLDSDFWSASFASGGYYQVEKIASLPLDQRRQQVNHLHQQLENVLGQLPEIEIEGKTMVQKIIEFLQLPLWKHRYELYSVWITTQLANVLSEYSMRIHQINGILNFSFAGTHVATVDDLEPRLHIWTELRSPLEKPVGKGRKKAIQPDYSLVVDPISSPESSIFVVECKQYKKESARNFSEALTDYANGRPNAQIVLVNYGPASKSILNKIDESIRTRTHIIGDMRPGSESALYEFKQLVLGSLAKYYKIDKNAIISSTNRVERITLKWKESPADLDLYLKVDTTPNSYLFSFSEKGSSLSEPWVNYLQDVRSGYGPEIIEITKTVIGKYSVFVQNYSNEVPLAGCGAILTLIIGGEEVKIQCPEEGEGSWWQVVFWDTDLNAFEIVNQITIDKAW